MNIYTAEQIRQLDQFTIKHEPISSIDLMERASTAFTNHFIIDFPNDKTVQIFCGAGNNAGDGLAIARLLFQKGITVNVFLLQFTAHYSEDFKINLRRIEKLNIPIHEIKSIEELKSKQLQGTLIDAIFGSGLNKPVTGFLAEVIIYLNETKLPIVSVDIPSGIFADQTTNSTAVQATKVYSFQYPKLAFMLPENAKYIQDWKVVDIGLLKEGESTLKTNYEYLTKDSIQSIYQSRGKFSHKGTYGHLLLIAGSKGKAGAAILTAKAALRSGIGLLSLYVPDDILPILQEAVPEAMCLDLLQNELLENLRSTKTYPTIAIGPGLGTENDTSSFMEALLNVYSNPMVIDADGLNILSQNKSLLEKLPRHSILTPHPGEFKRLVGDWNDDFERLALQTSLATKYNVIVVLKGANTSIVNPEGEVAFNSTGNNGMATAGSGDTLTGIIAGLLTQGYIPFHAAKLGVYLHGLAGDLALDNENENSLIASDITAHLGKAFKAIEL
ncbi:MAG: NAD(P)H-hydrate dehydratase [Chitinophagales bacterium]